MNKCIEIIYEDLGEKIRGFIYKYNSTYYLFVNKKIPYALQKKTAEELLYIKKRLKVR